MWEPARTILDNPNIVGFPAQLGLDPLTIAAVVFALLIVVTIVGVAYAQGVFSGLLSGRGTTTEPEEPEEGEEDSTDAIAGGQPFDASEDAGEVTPSGRQPGGGTKVRVRGTRKVGPLGTLIEAKVENGEIGVGDTVSFDDIGIEGRIGKLERDGQNIETASDGDVVSFSLVGVDDAPVEEGTVGEKETQ